jgi:hypothetical protein
MRRLSERASGLRHLRWSREVLGSIEARYEHDPRRTQADRDLLIAEAVDLRAVIKDLSAAVKAYRDYRERERTTFRGLLRLGKDLVARAPDDDAKAEAEALDAGFREAFANIEASETEPRRQAVRAEVAALRNWITEMEARLSSRFGSAFVESLFPDVTAGGNAIIDVEDDDDDATSSAA